MKQSKYDTNKDGVCDAKECSNLVMINRNTPAFDRLRGGRRLQPGRRSASR